MVHLDKHRLSKGESHKLQMRKVGPCKIPAKYGANTYQVDLPIDMGLSTTFNVANLVSYKGPIRPSILVGDTNFQYLATLLKLSTSQSQVEKILSSKVVEVTRKKKYMKHLVKWVGNPYSEATWVGEGDFKNQGIDPSLIPSYSPRRTFNPLGEYSAGVRRMGN